MDETATRVEERSVESSASAVEWAAIFGGALAAFGVTAILLTLGPGLGPLQQSRHGHSRIHHRLHLGRRLRYGWS